jgi:hypothetical protein
MDEQDRRDRIELAQKIAAQNAALGNDRYHPRQLTEMLEDEVPVSLINEPIREVIELRPGAKQRPLHAVLVESLNSTQALLARLEAGVTVPQQAQREVVRLLYVATRHQVQALTAVLELEGLE